MATWREGQFFIAQADGPHERSGFVCESLGLHCTSESLDSIEEWTVTHLKSGHAIAYITGSPLLAQKIAGKLADCSDWAFDALDGWKNTDPALPIKVVAIVQRHRRHARLTTGEREGDPEVARAVAAKVGAEP